MRNFQNLLKEEAENPIYNADGDEIASSKAYLYAGFDLFLKRAIQALMDDGLSAKNVGKCLTEHLMELALKDIRKEKYTIE